ncbi:hypothetical protein [Rhizobium sp. ZW T2_16]|uniref:hypothetical protein n=1 Tax=Rhizobium sp. ZW T2_16 TaxID=3378083 RepID=UPI003854F40A
MRLTVDDTLHHLRCHDILPFGNVAQVRFQLFLLTLTGLARRLQLLVDLILDRRGAFDGEKAGRDCVKDATLEFGSADRP